MVRSHAGQLHAICFLDVNLLTSLITIRRIPVGSLKLKFHCIHDLCQNFVTLMMCLLREVCAFQVGERNLIQGGPGAEIQLNSQRGHFTLNKVSLVQSRLIAQIYLLPKRALYFNLKGLTKIVFLIHVCG